MYCYLLQLVYCGLRMHGFRLEDSASPHPLSVLLGLALSVARPVQAEGETQLVPPGEPSGSRSCIVQHVSSVSPSCCPVATPLDFRHDLLRFRLWTV